MRPTKIREFWSKVRRAGECFGVALPRHKTKFCCSATAVSVTEGAFLQLILEKAVRQAAVRKIYSTPPAERDDPSRVVRAGDKALLSASGNPARRPGPHGRPAAPQCDRSCARWKGGGRWQRQCVRSSAGRAPRGSALRTRCQARRSLRRAAAAEHL